MHNNNNFITHSIKTTDLKCEVKSPIIVFDSSEFVFLRFERVELFSEYEKF